MRIVDAEKYVRLNTRKFFRLGEPNGVELAQALVGDAMFLGVPHLVIGRFSKWWIIGGSIDWIGVDAEVDVFSRIVPFPEAGVNSMRAEILAVVFASAVITSCNGVHRIVKGSVSQESVVWRQIHSSKPSARIIAFRFDDT